MNECAKCDKPATWRVDGWIEDGTGEGPGYQELCDEHARPYLEEDKNSTPVWPDDGDTLIWPDNTDFTMIYGAIPITP